MTDPAFAILTALVFFLVLAGVRWFKTLDLDVWRSWRTAFPAGIVCGVIFRFTGTNAIVTGLVLTIAAVYVRLTGEESEASDGMIFGAAAGATAGLTLLILGRGAGFELAQCLLAGAVAGFGVTFASQFVGQKLQQLTFDAVTAVAAVTVAAVPPVVRDNIHGIDDRTAAMTAAALIPLLVILTVFKQWRDVTAELSHEASLGFLDDADVRSTAHPFSRLGRAAWSDARAHRVFVRLATLLALRKRQQRHRPDEVARLYQLEIIKLRMQIQEMARIDHDVANAASDTMPEEGMRHE